MINSLSQVLYVCVDRTTWSNSVLQQQERMQDLFRLEQQDVDQSCKATWWDSAWALLTGEDPCTGKAAPGTEL